MEYKDAKSLREESRYLEYYLRASKVVAWVEKEVGIEDEIVLDTLYYELFTRILNDIDEKEEYDAVALELLREMEVNFQ